MESCRCATDRFIGTRTSVAIGVGQYIVISFVFASRGGLPLTPRYLQYPHSTVTQNFSTVRDAGFVPETTASVVWNAGNEPPHIHHHESPHLHKWEFSRIFSVLPHSRFFISLFISLHTGGGWWVVGMPLNAYGTFIEAKKLFSDKKVFFLCFQALLTYLKRVQKVSYNY